MVAVDICSASSVMPDGLRALEAEARSSGVRNVAVLVDRWVDGSERYAAPGEALLVARVRASGQVVGVGALGRCPDVPGALRVRRFYVGEQWRRRGIARTLVGELIAGGLRHTDVLTCNARASDAAAPFWEAMGFEPVEIEGITHRSTAWGRWR